MHSGRLYRVDSKKTSANKHSVEGFFFDMPNAGDRFRMFMRDQGVENDVDTFTTTEVAWVDSAGNNQLVFATANSTYVLEVLNGDSADSSYPYGSGPT